MNETIIETASPEATRRLGAAIGRALRAGARLALIGPLGAGKTCLTQGLAEGLGCEGPARSPSYVLVNEYEGQIAVAGEISNASPIAIYHCDWYRLETDADVESTGFEDLMRPDSIVIVEWAEKHIAWLPEPRLEIEIEPLHGEERRIHLRDATGAYSRVIDDLRLTIYD